MKSLAFARTGLVFSSLALSAGVGWFVWPEPRVDPSKPITWVTPDYVRHSGHYTFEPNTRLERINERHERIAISIDEHGLRNMPGALPSSRVLVLGDSFVNALATRDDQTFTAALSNLLDKPVYNAGVVGYSTFQATRLLRDLLKEGANPETVVLVFFLGNDFRDNYMDWARQSEVGWMSSYVVSQLLSYRKTPTDQFRKAFRRTGEALDQLKALCAEQGRRLIVVGVPARAEVLQSVKEHPSWKGIELAVFEWEADHSLLSFDGPDRRLADMLHSRNIEYISLLASFRANVSEGLYFDKDPHWTPRGQGLAAQILADHLRRSS